MRTDAAGQSALLMVDVAEVLAARGIPYAVIGAMAAAVHGVVRASLDADAVVSAHVAAGRELQREFAAMGCGADLRVGDVEDPIPALLAITDQFGNRVDLLIGLRGMDPAAMKRSREVALSGFPLRIIGREDFIAMKAHAGGPQHRRLHRCRLAAARSPITDRDDRGFTRWSMPCPFDNASLKVTPARLHRRVNVPIIVANRGVPG